MLKSVDVLVVNETEAYALTGRSRAKSQEPMAAAGDLRAQHEVTYRHLR